jgi:hypothetical protein
MFQTQKIDCRDACVTDAACESFADTHSLEAHGCLLTAYV